MGLLDDIMLGIEIVGGGVGEARKQGSERQAIAQATQELQALGLPAANEIAQLLQQDPRAANRFVESRYGSWPQMFQQFTNQSQAQAAAESLRAAGGGAQVSDAVRARREFAAGQLDAGGGLPSAGQLGSLFPGQQTAAQLGINAQDWEGDSFKAFLIANQALGGVDPPYHLLQPRKDATGGIPAGMKLPTGYFYDPSDPQKPVKAIPGTLQEAKQIYADITLQALREGMTGNVDDWADFLERNVGYTAFVQGHLNRPEASAIEKAFAGMLAARGGGSRPTAIPRAGGGTTKIPTRRTDPAVPAPSPAAGLLRDEL